MLHAPTHAGGVRWCGPLPQLLRCHSRPNVNSGWRSEHAVPREVAPVVLGYLRAQQVPEPEDLTAEVFYQVVRSLGQFEGGESEFRSWVLAIAHRKLIDDYRSRSRRPAEPATVEVLESHASSGNVEQEALDQLGEAEFRYLLSGLTSEQRDVLLLRMLGGLTVSEVAVAIGKRPAAVQAMQQRALVRLRKISRLAATEK